MRVYWLGEISCTAVESKNWSCCTIILKFQHNVLPFIVVAVYNYRIVHFAETSLKQIAQKVKLAKGSGNILLPSSQAAD